MVDITLLMKVHWYIMFIFQGCSMYTDTYNLGIKTIVCELHTVYEEIQHYAFFDSWNSFIKKALKLLAQC